MDARESLELISSMIRKTRSEERMKRDYGTFLYYGYSAVILSAAAWILVHFTGRMEFMLIWFAMFLPFIARTVFGKKDDPAVTTYIDDMLSSIWKVTGSMFWLTVIAIAVIGLTTGEMVFSIMMPLSIIYAGMGTSMTGLILKEKWFIWPPLAGLLAAVYMLADGKCDNSWNILFGMAFILFMVIPGHAAGRKIGMA